MVGKDSSPMVTTVAPVSANSDDWALVSAPPPPGPYRAVNLDPRIPGSDRIPGMENTPVTQSGRRPVSLTSNATPAAGVPAHYPPPQVPGRYQSTMPRPPVNVRYPAPVGRPIYGAMPPRGYRPSYPYQPEPVVPPPPVYDAMMRSPPGGTRR